MTRLEFSREFDNRANEPEPDTCALYSRSGEELTAKIAFYDPESGNYVGADCDNGKEIRYYAIHQLMAANGDIQSTLELTATKESTDSPRYATDIDDGGVEEMERLADIEAQRYQDEGERLSGADMGGRWF